MSRALRSTVAMAAALAVPALAASAHAAEADEGASAPIVVTGERIQEPAVNASDSH